MQIVRVEFGQIALERERVVALVAGSPLWFITSRIVLLALLPLLGHVWDALDAEARTAGACLGDWVSTSGVKA